MAIINICNRIIEYSFYSLFFFVPLALASDTFELFEFNKMWLTFALTIIIGTSWIIKIIVQRQFYIQRTPLDVPIGLFLASQVISTILSWDPHISLWGYYSRFNGGLLSIITYVFLYYSFVSNLAVVSIVKRSLFVSLLSGLIVALWGLPSHFGYDPTCFLFRGSFDVSCWTTDFQPKVRIFSTLGQPSWLAAYLAILLPISLAFAIQKTRNTQITRKSEESESRRIRRDFWSSDNLNVRSTDLPSFPSILIYRVFRVFWSKQTLYILLSALFYLDLLYTSSKSGFVAIWISLAFFFAAYFWINRKKFYILLLLVLITFLAGQPFSQLERFTFEGIKKNITSSQSAEKTPGESTPSQRFAVELGGTDSGKIRLLVWQGAISAWQHYPIFGTGVETFAFAYYRFKPESHNLTSEWNFLYNKAHNEYLNYLATTGTVGLGTYLLMIGWFLFISFKRTISTFSFQKTQNTQKSRLSDSSESLIIRQSDSLSFPSILIIIALLASYISILITNFFGFSVVITNIYLFLIPAFVFVVTGTLNPALPDAKRHLASQGDALQSKAHHVTPWRWTFIALVIIVAIYMLMSLLRFWNADKAYALGSNLNKAGEYQQAYPKLVEAVEKRAGEPVFKDELAVNNAVLASALISQDEAQTSTDAATLAQELAQNAIGLNDLITSKHPNNIIFWKSRVRIFYTLSQADPRYLEQALESVKKAQELAPTDANISYNLGVLYSQNNEVEKGIETLHNTIKLKPDYRDAYYGLGLFYHDQAVDDSGKVVDRDKLNKAIVQLEFILENLGGEDKVVQETLNQWKKL